MASTPVRKLSVWLRLSVLSEWCGASAGADVDEVVGGADDVFVVFDHNDGVAHVAELAQHANEAIGVARVQPDGGFVEDVETAHQAAAE